VTRDSVLLLGGTGFIGSALAKRLEQEKITAHVLGRHDVERLEHVLPQCGTVVHLASVTTPGSSAIQPSLELSNLNLTLRLLGLLKQQPQAHLIFFSSGGTIYGNAERMPITEDSPIAPLSNHGAGKASQEAFCQAARAQGHAITILRPSNAYGSGQGLRSGFGLVRTMLEHARAGTPLEIWGDGENVRDFIYIDDIVEACIRLIRRPQDSGTYNLGSGTGYSVNQARDIVEEVTGAELKVSRSPTRHIDVRSVVLDIGHIQRELDWTPKIVLDEGVRRTWRWLRREAP
jgi:UDP-glucose 4-epimerase